MSPAPAHQLVTTDELHNHGVEQQHQSSAFMEDPPLFSTPNPHQHHMFSQHQNHFHQHPLSSLNFKLGLNENTTVHGGLSNLVLRPEARPSSLLLPNSWHTQQLSDEPIKDPFWKPLNRCNEREAIYSRAGSASALTGEIGATCCSVPSIEAGRPRKRKKKAQLSFVVGFFECFVKQVMEHQEGLHKKLLEAIERTDQERTEREEAWRSQEAEKRNREALSRAQHRAMTSSKEARVVQYLEKITGQSVEFKQAAEIPKCRWPEGEIEALISTRVRLERKFQEPGIKGPLWEEVSSAMASMGYRRSAKRCKEKWDNINKYFKKKKDSTNANPKPKKKSSQPSKTCSYFNQLDQLYSKTYHGLDNDDPSQQRGGYTELLAYIVAQNPDTTHNLNASEKEPSSSVFEANASFDEKIDGKDPNNKVETEERSESRARHDQ